MEKRMFLLMVIYLFSVFVVEGCATTSTTTKTETVTTQDTKGASTIQNNQDSLKKDETSPKAEETSTMKVEKRTESESRGVLGTTVHFIGQVLAFPFKVIAGAIEFIF